jgi:hypothetical protein
VGVKDRLDHRLEAYLPRPEDRGTARARAVHRRRAALERLGYRQIKKRGKGSYVFMKCEGRTSLSVPLHDPIAKGTLGKLISDAGSDADEFRELL